MPFKTKEDYNIWKRRRHHENMDAYRAMKEATPCVDCNQLFPHYVTEYDHVPERGKKKTNVAMLAGTRKMTAPTFVEEIKKCDLICANCHKIRTYIRQQNSKPSS